MILHLLLLVFLLIYAHVDWFGHECWTKLGIFTTCNGDNSYDSNTLSNATSALTTLGTESLVSKLGHYSVKKITNIPWQN